MASLNRRRVLRGILNGGAVTVALPLLTVHMAGEGEVVGIRERVGRHQHRASGAVRVA